MIVYHFNPEFAPFGYLGVDLFFIISGFLITKQLIKSIEQESFKIKPFTKSNAWGLLPVGKDKFKKGDYIDCYTPTGIN